ncbi:hypothetical protein [Paenibacillus flagellatus]|uniref:hypothetical protein n=1 Tax=Paenibacillus flagellatus TaxID=2211139 RepID=UPI0013053FFA|nr:hypothetical protein [Paenibacillus flagellatus]
MVVTPKQIPVRHNGKRFAPGEPFEIDRKGYERIASHLDILDEDDEQEVADPALEALRERGKELGIRGWHSMGPEKLAAAVAEKEAELAAQGTPGGDDPAAQGGAGDGDQ